MSKNNQSHSNNDEVVEGFFCKQEKSEDSQKPKDLDTIINNPPENNLPQTNVISPKEPVLKKKALFIVKKKPEVKIGENNAGNLPKLDIISVSSPARYRNRRTRKPLRVKDLQFFHKFASGLRKTKKIFQSLHSTVRAEESKLITTIGQHETLKAYPLKTVVDAVKPYIDNYYKRIIRNAKNDFVNKIVPDLVNNRCSLIINCVNSQNIKDEAAKNSKKPITNNINPEGLNEQDELLLTEEEKIFLSKQRKRDNVPTTTRGRKEKTLDREEVFTNFFSFVFESVKESNDYISVSIFIKLS